MEAQIKVFDCEASQAVKVTLFCSRTKNNKIGGSRLHEIFTICSILQYYQTMNINGVCGAKKERVDYHFIYSVLRSPEYILRFLYFGLRYINGQKVY